jgi:hypothetical protein
MIRNAALRAIIAVGVIIIAIWLLGQLLLSVSWLTTLGWTVAWIAAIAIGVAVFIGLGREKQPRSPAA